jgi:hypothetical protein
MTAALSEVRDILHSYRRAQQAQDIAQLIHLRGSDSARFEQMIISDDVWSGPHALWEVSLYEDAMHPRDAVKDDTRRFRDAVIRLVETMEAEGLHNTRAQAVSKSFVTWNKLGR